MKLSWLPIALLAAILTSVPASPAAADSGHISGISILGSSIDVHTGNPTVTLRLTCLVDVVHARIHLLLTQTIASSTSSSLEVFTRLSWCAAGDVVTFNVRFGVGFLPGRAQISGFIGTASNFTDPLQNDDVGPATLLLHPVHP